MVSDPGLRKARRRRMILEGEPFIKPYEEYEAFGLFQLKMEIHHDVRSGRVKEDSIFHQRILNLYKKRELANKNKEPAGRWSSIRRDLWHRPRAAVPRRHRCPNLRRVGA